MAIDGKIPRLRELSGEGTITLLLILHPYARQCEERNSFPGAYRHFAPLVHGLKPVAIHDKEQAGEKRSFHQSPPPITSTFTDEDDVKQICKVSGQTVKYFLT